MFIIKIEDGYATLYDLNEGGYRRIGDQGAVSGVVQGNTIVITYSDGKVVVYDMHGQHLRTI